MAALKTSSSRWLASSPVRRPIVLRTLTTTSSHRVDAEAGTPSAAAESQSVPPSGAKAPLDPRVLDPNIVTLPSMERKLRRAGIALPGSRRRRAVLKSAPHVPLEKMPYQCFQEARKVLLADREEKLEQIEAQRGKILRLLEQDPSVSGGELAKKTRLHSMRRYLEKLKVQADVNDPAVKKRFEDGEGDMNKPVYRFLADRKWHEYPRKIVMQRITQMNVVPDVLPHIDPIYEVNVAFGRRRIPPGDIVDSRISASPATLSIQPFDAGERLATIAVVDPDVPNVETDNFGSRCHYLATNVPLSPATGKVSLGRLSAETQVVLPWMPPFSQKGLQYQRLAVVVFEQRDGAPTDLERMRLSSPRDGLTMRQLMARFLLKPVGINMFRTVWDEGTEGVMRKAEIEGWDIEFQRKKIEPLPKKRRNLAKYR
ncbi:mitochondrial large ribosomal subunit YmL35 [Lineolata rhizophorae]|uniref:Large ribosomal subunit protein mL38 n=1 Tax=Lineolata rhizophorae TaxID=578093 RepID=A0A6A6PDZ6_9PEZI|nr:mitochondrial large ribosomal subunit YmL35 [Lineolata rhizophorae]